MSKKHILVIDDEPLIRLAMADYLSEHGYDTTTAADGLEGLTKARMREFDAVLVDLRMPRMDGLEVIDALKAEQPTLPIVVVSGTGVLNDAVEAIRRGASDYVTKPVRDMDEIILVIEQVLEKANLIEERNRYQQQLEQLNRLLEAKVVRQTEDLQIRNRNLTVLNRVISTATSTLNPVNILTTLCQELGKAFDLPSVVALLIQQENDNASIVAEYTTLQERSLLGWSIPYAELTSTPFLQNHDPTFVQDLENAPRLQLALPELRKREIATLLIVPLVVRERVMSILGLGDTEERAYDDADLELIQSAAAAAAQALEAVSLHQELQKYAETLEATVEQRTEELQAALIQARAANRAKSQFISNVSHELRTPLTSIKLYLGLLEAGREDQRPRYLESLCRETDRLQTLIESILTISRLDLGKTQAHPAPTDLNQLLRTLAMDRLKLFAEHGLALHIDLEENLPMISADAKLLEQVATNLLTNAMNYTPANGEITLSTGRTNHDGQAWAIFCVKDNGPGITPEDQEHLFERFYRGSAGQNSKAPGTGLGLSICKEIIDLHQGRIMVESAVRKGSTFTVWLPCNSPPHTVTD